MKLVLEARHLFDGSVHAVTHHAAHLADSTHHHADGQHHASSGATPAAAAPAAGSATPHDGAAHRHHDDIPGLKYNPNATQLLVVDTQVENWQQLIQGIDPNIQVVLVHPNEDGLAKVTQAIDSHHDLTAIQFLTHGDTGSITLGNSVITADTLYANQSEVASWGDHLAPGADIEFWGCDVGQGDSGQAFVNAVHSLTGATVGASTDATGAASLGGNWTLEDTTGALAVSAPFSATAMQNYQDLLGTPHATVTLSGITGSLTGDETNDVLLGDTFTQTLTFQNDGGAVGYGPVVNLFVTTSGSETAQLQSWDYLGATTSIDAAHALTLVDNGGVIGAFNPFVLDASGQPTFIAAPSSDFKVGDTMYVLVLPFGSYTPGQPPASITLNYKSDATSDASANSGQSIHTQAVGTYEFGADALNNPSTDPPITDTANESSEVSSTVSLVHVIEKPVLPEDETATGPDNAFNYEIDIIAAPALSQLSAPIDNMVVQINLPDGLAQDGTVTVVSGNVTLAAFENGTTLGDGTIEGGDVKIDLGNFSTTTVVDAKVYVPQYFSDGTTPILQATSGTHGTATIDANYQTLISENPAYHYTGSWTYPGHSPAESINVTSTTPVQFWAKALAIQVSDSTDGNINGAGGNGSIAPGQQGITERIDFQVSDYVDLNNLVITDVLGDGLTLDPSNLQALLSLTNFDNGSAAISGQDLGSLSGVSTAGSGAEENVTSGSGTFWSVNQDSTTHETTLTFDIGAFLLANPSLTTAGAVIQGGGNSGPTSGEISFTVNALDSFQHDNNASYLAEGDSVGAQVTNGTTAGVSEHQDVGPGGAVISTGSTTDTSGLTDVVPENNLVLEIYSVNGTHPPPTSNGQIVIQPGDQVTYQLVYTFADSDDFGNNQATDNNLVLTGYLPLPIFELLNDGSISGVSATSSDSALASNVANAQTNYSVDSTSNSVSFDLGQHSDTTNSGAGATITIQFTTTASDLPFADGLFLTSQAHSTDFDASAQQTGAITNDKIQQIQLQQPEVVTKTGVVNVKNDSGTTVPVTYSTDPNDTESVAPGVTYANTAGAGTIFSGGATNNDENAIGADGGDTVTYVTTVDNVGSATAFGVEVQGALPTGTTNTDVTSFQIVDHSGVAISLSDMTDLNGNTFTTMAQAQAAFFSTGIRINDAGLTAGSHYFVKYDVHLPTTQTTGTTLTATGTILNWWNDSSVVGTGADGFVSGTSGTGVADAGLTDAALLTVSSPAIAKTITGSGENSDSDVPLGTNHNVVQGDTVNYQLVVTLPEGITDNSNDVTITDVLPAGMTYTGGVTVTFGTGVTSTEGSGSTIAGSDVDYDVATNTVTFHLGQLTATGDHSSGNTVTIQYTATLSNTLTPGANAFTNNATLTFNGNQTASATATAHEVDPNIVETITPSDTAPFDGENLTYTVSLQNTGTAQADNTAYYIEVPSADLVNIAVGTASDAGNGATITDVATESIGGVTYEILKVQDPTIAVGATSTFTFTAQVNQNLPANTAITVQTPSGDAVDQAVNGVGGTLADGSYNSLPNNTGHAYAGTGTDTINIAQVVPNLGIIGESNGTSGISTDTNSGDVADGLFTGSDGSHTAAVSSVDATVGDIIRYSAYAQIPEGQNSNFQMTVTLPAGMDYADLASNGVTVMLVSPDGSTGGLSSSGAAGAIDSSAETGYTGTYDPTTAVATVTLSAADITYNATNNTVTFNLGTLTDNENSAKPDYAIVQFNAVVANVAGNAGTSAGAETSLAAHASVGSTNSSNATVTVEEPHVTLTKSVSNISYAGGSATITYVDTLTNTGTATAYDVNFDDPEASGLTINNDGSFAEGGTNTSALTVDSGVGTGDLTATGSLGAGKTQTFTYTVTVPNASAGVADTTTTVTYTSLNSTGTGGAAGTETLAGTTTGASGTGTGSRDGVTAPLTVNNYEAQVTLGLAAVSGQVWNDIGPDNMTFGETGSDDTGLGGVDVNVNGSYVEGVDASGTNVGGSLTQHLVTASDGTYLLLTPDGSVTVSVPESGGTGTNNVGPAANESSVFITDGTPPANSTTTAATTGSITVAASTPKTVDFSYQTPDTAPSLGTAWGNPSFTGSTPTVTYTEGTSPVALSSGASVTDTEIDESTHNYDGSVLTIERYSAAGTAAPSASDIFSGTGTSTAGVFLSGGNVSLDGTVVGTYTQTGNGVLAITFTAAMTSNTTVNSVLNGIGYSSTDSNVISSGIKIGATIDDHNQSDQQGTGGDKTSAPVYVTLNEIPGAAVVTYTEPNDSSAQNVAQSLDASLSLTASTTNLESATVTLTGPGGTGSALAEDQLFVDLPPSAIPDLTVTFSGGVLTLTATSGSASVAEFQTALQAVKFYDNSDTPNGVTSPTDATHDRTVTVQITDTNSDTVTAATIKARVVANNDSPVLGNTTPETLNGTEDDAAPTNGTLPPDAVAVSSLVSTAGITDTDGNDTINGGTPSADGVAITQADTTEGTWWYTTDGGAHWTAFASNSMTAVSAANALHLAGDANTYVYFQPAANWNNTTATAITPALTIQAWDGFDGAANGSFSALPTDSAFGTGQNTQASAYSADSETFNLVVAPVNDAPVASGSASIDPVAEDTTNPPGATVSSLLGQGTASYSDATDTVSGGSTGTPAAGIAITGNAATPNEGTWEYSTDGGTTWVSIPSTGLSDTNAIVIPVSAELRFLPAPNYNGDIGSLTARVSDGTALPTTGAHDLSGTIGGTGGWSDGTVTINTGVTAVNDAPIASGGGVDLVPPATSNPQDPSGQTVSTLYGPAFDDSTDQQHTTANPDGSTANTLAGIAVTGNNATPDQGTWQYSTDGGNTWTSISTTVGENNATIIPASAEIRFLPNGSFNGTPGSLVAHVIDSSDGAIAAVSTGVDLTTPGSEGGISAVSAGTVPLNTTVATLAPPIFTPPQPPQPPVQQLPQDTDLGRGGFDNQHVIDNSGHPIIPQVSLIGTVGNKFIIEQQLATIAVPENMFTDSFPGASLTYSAESPDGGPLPPWLDFDPRNLTFTGTPPAGSHGAVDVVIVARDQFGNEATASFRILVGRPPADLAAMLNETHTPAGNEQGPANGRNIGGQNTDGHGENQNVGNRNGGNNGQANNGPANNGRASNGQGGDRGNHNGPPAHNQQGSIASPSQVVHLANAHGPGQVDMFASMAQPAGHGPGRVSFSAQLREAGRAGQLAQARRLLDNISTERPAKPAA